MHMIDMNALSKSLPTFALEPARFAYLINSRADQASSHQPGHHIALIEPPSSDREPYIHPVAALAVVLKQDGVRAEDASAKARELIAANRDLSKRWVHFMDDCYPSSGPCVPCSDFIAWVRESSLLPATFIHSLQQAVETATVSNVFANLRDNGPRWSLANKPTKTPSSALMEFMPGPPWRAYRDKPDMLNDGVFMNWRNSMQETARRLEDAWGACFYYFADLNDELDDDWVHRYLMLHWCCTAEPDSSFVKFLVQVSGAESVEELRVALINPQNYVEVVPSGRPWFELDIEVLKLDLVGRWPR